MDGYENDFDEAFDLIDAAIEADLLAYAELEDEAFAIIFDQIDQEFPENAMPEGLYGFEDEEVEPFSIYDDFVDTGDTRGPFAGYDDARAYADALGFSFYEIIYDERDDIWYVDVTYER